MRNTGHTLRFGGNAISKRNFVTLPDGETIKHGHYRRLTCAGKYRWKDILNEEKANVFLTNLDILFTHSDMRHDYNFVWRRRNKQRSKNLNTKRRRNLTIDIYESL